MLMKQIAVIDYDAATVYIYDLPTDIKEDTEDIEKFITEKQHYVFDWLLGTEGKLIPIVVNGFSRSNF